MTKRLIIGLVALALFVLVVMVPVSALRVNTGPDPNYDYYYNVSAKIGSNATVFLGEDHLNLVGVEPNTWVGFWPSGTPSGSPAKSTYITTPGDFLVDRAAFDTGGSIADWYNVTCVLGNPVDVNTCLVFRVADPGLDIAIFAPRIAADVTGQSVLRGELLRFGIVNTLYPALTTNRTPVYNTSTGDGYIDIKVMNQSGFLFNQLYTKQVASPANLTTIRSINATTSPYYWGLAPLDAAAGGSAGVPPFAWQTNASMNGRHVYKPGTYEVWAESRLNDMREKYLNDGGGYYTGKTVSTIKTITLTVKPSKIGLFRSPGIWILDYNGNFAWDGVPTDSVYTFGGSGDIPVIGDWNGDGKPESGVFNNGIWYLDYNGNGVYDGSVFDRTASLGSAGYKPVVGDWNGDGKDKIGVEKDGIWAIDYNGNYQWDGAGTDRFAAFGQTGDNPVIGDWDGTGIDKIGSEKDGFWAIDYNGNYLWDGPPTDRFAGFGQAGDKPVIGDWNGDGKDKIGMEINGFWATDYNGNYLWDGAVTDRFAGFGSTGDKPVVGDWSGSGNDKIGSFKDGFWAIDYNGNYQWDGVGFDRFAGFGSAGDTPFAGRW